MVIVGNTQTADPFLLRTFAPAPLRGGVDSFLFLRPPFGTYVPFFVSLSFVLRNTPQ